MELRERQKLIIAVSGASGSVYARVLMEELGAYRHQFEECAVIFTSSAEKVWRYELGGSPAVPDYFRRYQNDDLFAPPASGSAGYTTMIIIPCSMGMMGRIAHGAAGDLISRAADVMLKERRKLILVTREMPLNLIHIRNMKTLTLAGAVICPASPSFYSLPADMDSLIRTVTGKVLELGGIARSNFEWGKS